MCPAGPIGWGRTSPHSAMTLAALEALIASNIETVRVPTRRGGGKARLLPLSYLKPILSVVRTALLYQVARRRNVDVADARRLLRDGEDVTPYLMSMPEAGAERARLGRGDAGDHSSHRRPGNAANLARLGLRLACPSGTAQAWSKGGSSLVPVGWKPVIDDVERAYLAYRETTRRAQATVIRAFARTMWSAGHESPDQLPRDRTVVQEELRRAGLKASYANVAINTYNRAALRLNERGESLPVFEQQIDERLRGLRALPAEAFGADVDWSHHRTADLLPRIVPHIAGAFGEYATRLRGKDEKPKMQTHRRALLGRVVALMWQHRELLKTATSAVGGTVPREIGECELSDLYTLEVSVVRRGPSVGNDTDTATAAAGIAERLRARVGLVAGAPVRQPLVRVLVDACVRELRAGNQSNRTSRKPYPPSVIGLLDNLTKVTRDVLRAAVATDSALAAALEPVMTRVNAVHRDTQSHMKQTNASAIEEGRAVAVEKLKPLLVSVVTLPQLVCIGLPRLADHVRRLEAAYRSLLAELEQRHHAAPERHESASRARDAWHVALEEYVALAMFTAHPLRLSNLAYGRIGSTREAEWRFTVDYDSTGTPSAIRSVEGHFAHRLIRPANPIASLKQKGKEQIWPLWPAIVDHDLLLSYMTTVRRRNIVSRGLLKDARGMPVTISTYSLREELEEGRLTLFIPGHNLKKQGNPLAYNGGFAGQSGLSSIVGRGLHRVARDILGHTHIPSFEECPGTDWEGLFAGHSLRSLWATYWYGMRAELEVSPVLADGTRVTGKTIAQWATTDDARTLEKEYVAVSARMRARLMDPVDSWTHPRACDGWMDRALRRESIDWTREAVPLPAGLDALTPATANVRTPQLRRPRSVAR